MFVAPSLVSGACWQEGLNAVTATVLVFSAVPIQGTRPPVKLPSTLQLESVPHATLDAGESQMEDALRPPNGGTSARLGLAASHSLQELGLGGGHSGGPDDDEVNDAAEAVADGNAAKEGLLATKAPTNGPTVAMTETKEIAEPPVPDAAAPIVATTNAPPSEITAPNTTKAPAKEIKPDHKDGDEGDQGGEGKTLFGSRRLEKFRIWTGGKKMPLGGAGVFGILLCSLCCCVCRLRYKYLEDMRDDVWDD